MAWYKKIKWSHVAAAGLVLERAHTFLSEVSPRYSSFTEEATKKAKRKFGLSRTVWDEVVDYMGTEDLDIRDWRFGDGQYVAAGFEFGDMFTFHRQTRYVSIGTDAFNKGADLSSTRGLQRLLEEKDLNECDHLKEDQIEFDPGPMLEHLPRYKDRACYWPIGVNYVTWEGTKVIIINACGKGGVDHIRVLALYRREDEEVLQEPLDEGSAMREGLSPYEGCVLHLTAVDGGVSVEGEEGLMAWNVVNLKAHLIVDMDMTRELRQGEYAPSLDLYSEEVRSLVERDIMSFIKKSSLLGDEGFDERRSYMFVGPPGTGKSYLIKEIISKLPDEYMVVLVDHESLFTLSSLGSYQWRHHLPVCVVIEDIDLLVNNPDETQMLLNFLDGLTSPDRMITLMTTNNFGDLSEAITNRPGRVDRVCYLGAGEEKQREAQLTTLMGRFKPPLDLKEVAQNTEGFTVAQYREVVRRSLMYSEDGIDEEGMRKSIAECSREFSSRKKDGRLEPIEDIL